MIRARTLFMMLLISALLAACESAEKTQRDLYRDNPLPFDPTEPYELASWWTNGEQLVELKSNHAYAIHSGQNRYKFPVEIGQWTQKNYAALELEPYGSAGPRVVRAQLDQPSNDAMTMSLPGRKIFVALSKSPPVTEDSLVGSWSSAAFRIIIQSDLRYRFQRITPLPAGSVGIGAHSGTWELVNGTMVLRPAAAGLHPIHINVLQVEDGYVLEDMSRE